MREWLRKVMGLTKLDRIEARLVALEEVLRPTALETEALVRAIDAAVTERARGDEDRRVQLQLLLGRFEALVRSEEQTLEFRKRIEQRLEQLGRSLEQRLHEAIGDVEVERRRADELATQCADLIDELGGARRALGEAKVEADEVHELRAALTAAQERVGLLEREVEAGRSSREASQLLEATYRGWKESMTAELTRIREQRDGLLARLRALGLSVGGELGAPADGAGGGEPGG